MKLFDRPLVALSLTPSDDGLLRYAAEISALRRCAQVRFAHVVSSDQSAPSEGLARELRDRMASTVKERLPGVVDRAAFDVVHGPRLDGLLKLSLEHKNDVVVVGHRSDRSGHRALARRLAMIGPSSIWLAPDGVPPRISGIVVPVDFSTHSADALSLATAIAAAQGLKQCRAVHVFFDPSTVRYDEHVAEFLGREEQAFQKFLDQVDCHGVEVEPVFEESTHPTQAILRVVHRYDADLIVMNTRGRSRASAVLLGSITSATMAASTVPLLAVKHFGSRMSVLEALLHHRHWEGSSPKTN